MDNMTDQVDIIERVTLSGDMVFTVYYVLEEGKGKYLFDKRHISEINMPYYLWFANQFEADEFGLLLNMWQNRRFGFENLGNVEIGLTTSGANGSTLIIERKEYAEYFSFVISTNDMERLANNPCIRAILEV